MKSTQGVDFKKLREEMEKTFVRGEIASLQWCSTMKSISTSERNHIVSRIKKLEQFLRGEIAADHDGTKARFVPDFHEGE
jgi:hypothetical protein